MTDSAGEQQNGWVSRNPRRK